jgi:ATP-dependent DNA helicase PIF1
MSSRTRARNQLSLIQNLRSAARGRSLHYHQAQHESLISPAFHASLQPYGNDSAPGDPGTDIVRGGRRIARRYRSGGYAFFSSYLTARPAHTFGRAARGSTAVALAAHHTGRIGTATGRASIARSLARVVLDTLDGVGLAGLPPISMTNPLRLRFRLEVVIDAPSGRQYRTRYVTHQVTDPSQLTEAALIGMLAAASTGDHLAGSNPYADMSAHDAANAQYRVHGVGVEYMRADGGGCGGRDRYTTVPCEDVPGHFWLVEDPYTEPDSNDCGIRCFMLAFRYSTLDLPRGFRKADSVRRRCGLEPGVPLGYDDLDAVAGALSCSYEVYASDGSLQHSYEHDGSRKFQLLHDDGHYLLMLRRIGTCGCGLPDVPDHSCQRDRVKCAHCGSLVIGGEHRCPWEPAMMVDRERNKRLLDTNVELARIQKQARIEEVANVQGGEMDDDPIGRIINNLFVLKVNVQFLLGQGGTGKTYAIRKIEEHVKRLNDRGVSFKMATVTSTGAAATLIDNATTIYNYCKIGVGQGDGDMWAQRLLHEKDGCPDAVELLRSLDLMVIDEVSMLEGRSFFDKFDTFLRIIRGQFMQPFGGLQLLLSGDSLQLPPVPSVDDYRDFFFDARIFEELRVKSGAMAREVLAVPRRFPSLQWFGLLTRARKGLMNRADHNFLETKRVSMRTVEEWNERRDFPLLFIASTCKVISEYNSARMARIVADTIAFHARDIRPIPGINYDKVAPRKVELKRGAMVMLTVNHGTGEGSYLEDHGVGNGSRGVVVDHSTFDDAQKWADVRFVKTGEVVRITPNEFLERTPTGMRGRVQIPLILAWGITMHRAQGSTVTEECLISLDNLFEFHMGYTALSRCAHMEKVWILEGGPIRCRVNERCLFFAERDDIPPVGVVDDGVGNFISNTIVEAPNEELQNLRCKRPSTQQNSVVTSMIDQKTIIVNAIMCEGERLTEERMVMDISGIEVLWLRSGCPDAFVRFRKVRAEQNVVAEFGNWLFSVLEEDANNYDLMGDQKNSSAKAWTKLPYRICAGSENGFDFSFFLQHIFETGMSNRFETTQIFKGSRLMYLSLRDRHTNKESMVVHDIAQVLNCTIDVAFKKFIQEPSDMEMVFPVKRLSRNDASLFLDETSAVPMTLRRDDFSAEALKVLDAKKTFSDRQKIFNDSFPDSSLSVFYDQGSFDCITGVNVALAFTAWAMRHNSQLRTLYIDVDRALSEIVGGTSVLNFSTTNGLATFGIMANLPPQATYATGTYKHIESRIFRLNGDMMEFVQEAVRGGKTVVSCDRFTSKDLGKTIDMSQPDWHQRADALVYFDINSMYPSEMLREYPFGRPYWGGVEDVQGIVDVIGDPSRWSYLREQCFIVRADVRGHKDDLCPVLSYKGEDGRTYWDTALQKGAVITSWDVYNVLQSGGVVENVRSVLLWPHKAPLYRQWIEKCMRLKRRGEEENNLPKRQLGKLLANCSFGSTLKGSYSFTSAICTTKEHFDRFFDKADWEGSYPYGQGICLWGQAKVAPEDRRSSSGMQGVFILAATREKRARFFTALYGAERIRRPHQIPLEPTYYYEDTDSCIFHCRLLPRVMDLLGDQLGEWSDEMSKEWDLRESEPGWIAPALLSQFFAAGPKAYALEYHLPQRTQLQGGQRLVYADFSTEGACVSKWKGVSGDPEAYFEADGLLVSDGMSLTVFKDLFRQSTQTANENEQKEDDNDNVFEVHAPTTKRLPAWCMSFDDRSHGLCPFSVTRDIRSVEISLRPYDLQREFRKIDYEDGIQGTFYVPVSYAIG